MLPPSTLSQRGAVKDASSIGSSRQRRRHRFCGHFGGAASAVEETSPEIAWVKNNVIVTGANPDQATIMATYRCSGDGVHLWASVKQGPNITEENNTSDFAESWYETPEGPTPVWNGKTHVLRYTVFPRGRIRRPREG